MTGAPETMNRIKGLPFFGLGGYYTTGNTFFVDSGATNAHDAPGSGTEPDHPFLTIDYAIGQCTASNGDIIYVMPGHAETIASASAITVDVAGISIIGLGNGVNRPVLTYSATTSTIVVSAAACRIANISFVGAINDLATFLTVSADDFTIENCRFRTSSTYEAFNFIGITTTYDYTTIKGCQFIQPTDPEGVSGDPATGCIYLVDSEYVTIDDCQFVGNFETAFFHNKTTAAGQLWIKDCYGYQALSDGDIGLLVAGATGGDMNGLYTNLAAADLTGAELWGTGSANFFSSSNYGNDSIGGGQGAQPIVATT